MKKIEKIEKVFLLGDFSSYHVNLSKGLKRLGVESTVLTTGDGWKKIDGDINIEPASKGLVSKLIFRLVLLYNLMRIKDYDVVQIMGFHCIYYKFFPFKYILNYLKKYNKKVILVAAGSDPFFWKYGKNNLSYGPFDDVIKYDLKGAKNKNQCQKLLKLNDYLAEKCDQIIPIMYEYLISYSHKVNIKNIIPIPIDLIKYNYSKNLINNKIVIFHGLNKRGFKGTHHVEKTFEMLSKKYPDELELIIDGNMPLDDYVNLLKRTNIIIDQLNSYSLGVNGLIGLAIGKVVIGGGEKESIEPLGIKETPVINVKPCPYDLFNVIEKILLDKQKISYIGYRSREFVEKHHDANEIARKFIETWVN